ncbi:MAG: O-methyltransferase [Planctomycetota bacterium]|jgi:predicted O-methyltransferase YrrM
MHTEFRSDDWSDYRMDYRRPHRRVEPLEKEVAVVDGALAALRRAGAVPHTRYDGSRMLAHREAVRRQFEIPWTAISPRVERLLYALNAIVRPPRMIAAGVFCGFTFISNAGAAVGSGACYTAEELVGVEIVPEEAERAERNVRRIDPTGVARVVADDAVRYVKATGGPIGLLYLDADGPPGVGKGIYLDILRAAGERIGPGALVLAHNSENSSGGLASYLDFVREPTNFRASVNVVLDAEGLEVSVR